MPTIQRRREYAVYFTRVQLAVLLVSAAAQAACDQAAIPRSNQAAETAAPTAAGNAAAQVSDAAGKSIPATTSVIVPDSSVQVRDSSGVRIIEPRAPLWTDADRWRLNPRFVQIGVLEGNPAYEFTYIDHGSIDANGRVAIADRAREVRVFNAAGKHLQTFGRVGDGPGEFRRAGLAPEMSLTFAAPDRLLVTDGRRIAWFSVDGLLQREVNVRNAIASADKLIQSFGWQVAPDGSLLFLGSAPLGRYAGDMWVSLMKEEDGKLNFITITDYHVEPGVPVDGPSGVPATRLNRPFLPTALAVAVKVNPLRVFVADPTRWEIRVHKADGFVEKIIRLPISRKPITSQWISAAREDLKTKRSKHPLQAQLLRAYDNLSHPDSMPAIVRLYWDDAGYLLVEHYSPGFNQRTADRKLEVLRENGAWLGQVVLPPDFGDVLQVNSGRILTSYIDADAVPFARIHTLVTRSARPPDGS